MMGDNRWIDEWIDGWMDGGCMDACMDGCLRDKCLHERLISSWSIYPLQQ